MPKVTQVNLTEVAFSQAGSAGIERKLMAAKKWDGSKRKVRLLLKAASVGVHLEH